MSCKSYLFLGALFYTALLLSPVESIRLDVNALVGLLCPVFTPMDSNGQLNLSLVKPYVNLLTQNGIVGVLLCGPAGEGMSLSLDERMQLLDAFIEIGKPLGLQIMLQVGGLPMNQILKLSAYAESLGVDAIVTIPDPFYKLNTVRELVYYLQQIASAAPNTPLIYYDIPSATCINVDIVQLFRQASCSIPNFVGVQTSVGNGINILATIQLTPNQRVLAATEINLANALQVGLNGTVSAVINLYPEETNNLLNAILNGDLNLATQIQIGLNKKLAAMGAMDSSDSGSLIDVLASLKVGMGMMNGVSMDMGQPRSPLPMIGSMKKKTMTQNLIDLGLNLDLLGLGINLDVTV